MGDVMMFHVRCYDVEVRTTVRIDDALLRELKEKASAEGTSLTRVFNQVLRAGLRARQKDKRPRDGYRETTHSLGTPRVDLAKALSLSTLLDDGETLRKLATRK